MTQLNFSHGDQQDDATTTRMLPAVALLSIEQARSYSRAAKGLLDDIDLRTLSPGHRNMIRTAVIGLNSALKELKEL